MCVCVCAGNIFVPFDCIMPETFGLPGISGTYSVARELNHAIANQSTEYVILFVTFTSTHW